jgi:hypothetical protein
MCGSEGVHVVENMEKNIYKDKCPLCNTAINETDSAEQNRLLKIIKKNDERILSKNLELENLILEVEGKKNDLDKAEIQFKRTEEKLSDFTEDNPNISFGKNGKENIDSLITQYRKQASLAEKEAKAEYDKRDRLKPSYEKLLKNVEASYTEAQDVFVPTFKKLAKSFIGLDLAIHLKSIERKIKTIKLVLELQNTARTESWQLSESQRFFLDIAMRMSLAIFLSSSKNGATMLVDTPEGSLDIAYESRVGTMFSEYVLFYHQNLFMTANINASQLLITLAEKCGKTNMKFRRMLDWTDLSEVQRQGEKYFKRVYSNIEKALNKK